MNASYELVSLMRRLLNGEEVFDEVVHLSVDEMYFQVQFVTCSETETQALLADFYLSLYRNRRNIPLDRLGSWMDESITRYTNRWLSRNRREMLRAEIRGLYRSPQLQQPELMGLPISAAEYTYVIECALCNLPEIFRQTAIAHYHNDIPAPQLTEELCLDEESLAARIDYIEKMTQQRLEEHCIMHSYALHVTSPLDIRMALLELARTYRYQYTASLLQQIHEGLYAQSEQQSILTA